MFFIQFTEGKVNVSYSCFYEDFPESTVAHSMINVTPLLGSELHRISPSNFSVTKL